MTQDELRRLIRIEERVHELADEYGLMTTKIDFEVCPARRILEAMSYHFPTNFSHWTFGRDFEKNRTFYEHTGTGIPYEQVWNFERPRALLVDTNPLPLNAMIIAHVYGHVDFFLASSFLKRGRSFSNVAEEARYAAERFRKYEAQYGQTAVEQTMDAALSIQWHQPLDVFLEEPDEEDARQALIAREKMKLASLEKNIRLNNKERAQETECVIRRLKRLEDITPPEPVYDILKYINRQSTRLKPFQQDIVSVLRNQARALAPNMLTKMLNEGWATYWHLRIIRKLTEEGLITSSEHGVWTTFHAKVTQRNKLHLNVYHLGPAIFEYAEHCWDTGRFGREYEDCTDPIERAHWDTGANKGKEKIFSMRESYSDRMAIEEFATDEFIRGNELYIYREGEDQRTGDRIAVIMEKNPGIIRRYLLMYFSYYGIPSIAVVDGNYQDKRIMLLKHDDHGMQLDETYIEGTLRHIHYLWGYPVYLDSIIDDKTHRYSFDGKRYSVD
ncbi:MAG: hypothetical protein COW88_03090 [Candidatus Lloydbacteria bacterium CG22_combo_CG10-13_8_21_14_all_47_15]|uniref:SpoVR family protein n=1 Tax=Candidatus Lloydbacteria bacterium CG22_combo_CG10-13_8_21_14_all_47_15 TaxID=1974635 RepID=A0A2H0CTN0_9BACT|nr:MAG: hypothetical protein COW88_03090 [Candidatus Lloydbacteria bacterium CG22_combo_CG10-13_8_21_14_all_47_15]